MEIIRLGETSISAAAKKAAQALRAGQLIIYPTDTIYGLGADAANPVALKRLRDVKGRETKKPISVIVPDIDLIEKYAQLSGPAEMLIERFLPGPLTLILPAKPTIEEEITLNGGIGIRFPNDLFCQTLARSFGKPFTSTSANLSGLHVATTIQGILDQLKDKSHDIGLVIDAGERAEGVPSTVVSCMGKTPIILREGVLSRDTLGI